MGHDDPDRSALAGRFAQFAATAVRNLPLYRRICEAASADPDVIGLAARSRPDQRVPNLLLAAVHDVVLGGSQSPLASWYRSVTPDARPVGSGRDDPWPHFRAMALDHPDVVESVRHRATQTNEVGRCTALLPALIDVAAEGGDPTRTEPTPLGLVEIGASAGLNLLLDRYTYRYRPGGGEGRRADRADGRRIGDLLVHPPAPADASLPSGLLDCELRGPVPSALHRPMPAILRRIGIDKEPVSIADPAQARWLIACQWPEEPDRIERARGAMDLARAEAASGRTPGVELRRGDAVADLPDAIGSVPAQATAVVLATWVLAYLTAEQQNALVRSLDRLGGTRDLTLIYAEQTPLVAELEAVIQPTGRFDDRSTSLVRVDWRGGRRGSAVRLARMHPHGRWLDWSGVPERS